MAERHRSRPRRPRGGEGEVSALRHGPGRLLVGVYAVLAISATARALFQLATQLSEAPLAYALSALSALVYCVATIALARASATSARVARAAITFELVGVLVVGTATVLDPSAFPDATVWSAFGAGYGYLPAVLPVAGLWWLARARRRGPQVDGDGDGDGSGGGAACERP